MGRMELIPVGDSGLGHEDPSSSPNTSINVESSPIAGKKRSSSKKRSREGNVVLTSSSYKYAAFYPPPSLYLSLTHSLILSLSLQTSVP